jgi:hypothetical protein
MQLTSRYSLPTLSSPRGHVRSAQAMTLLHLILEHLEDPIVPKLERNVLP